MRCRIGLHKWRRLVIPLYMRGWKECELCGEMKR